MAGTVRYTALLDACVLYPVLIMDALMSLRAAGFYTAKWTRRIESEWMRALVELHPHLAGRLEARRDQMRATAPDWEISQEAADAITVPPGLPDADDAHVVAAALVGHVDCIVTANLKDFPDAILGPLGIEVLDPDSFLVAQWDLQPIEAAGVFKRMRARHKQPPRTPKEFADVFEARGLAMMAGRLRSADEML